MILQDKYPTDSHITGEELLDAMLSTDTYIHLKIFMGYNPGAGALPQQF